VISGERLRQLRELHRLTQAGLAGRVPGLTQPRLSRLEAELTADASLAGPLADALGVRPEFLSRDPAPGLQGHSPQFRARTRMTSESKVAALQWARLVDEEYERLSAAAAALPLRLAPRPGATPAEAAAYARGALGFSAGEPLPYLVLALERAGVTVLGLPYAAESLDAFCAWRDGRPVVAVLDGAPGDRLRFSVAHELGHLLLHSARDLRREPVEREADRFAAELLMPEHAIRAALPARPTLTGLIPLKNTWGVSLRSLIRRAREVGVVDEQRAAGLHRQLSARGWTRVEPGFVPLEKPRAFRKLAEIAYGPDVPRLAAAAGWSEPLTRTVLDRHATADELPFESAPVPRGNVLPFVRPRPTRR
jgi:Zn-dependent peptidase ImmA (M78 family)/transcriptional regulator with XRE-family HTH domain